LLQQRLGSLENWRVEAFRKPVVDWREQIASFDGLTLIAKAISTGWSAGRSSNSCCSCEPPIGTPASRSNPAEEGLNEKAVGYWVIVRFTAGQ
jgi:hypothetical protein